MASFLLKSNKFPSGTTVSVYNRSDWRSNLTPGVAPTGAAVTTAVMGNSGVTIPGLAPGTRYVATASLSSTYPMVEFKTPAAADTFIDHVSPWMPNGAIAENQTRNDLSAVTTLTSARLQICGGLVVPAGQQINAITFMSGSTALSAGTHQWFGLFSSARAKLAVTADDTSTAWSANAAKTLTLAAPYTPAAETKLYVGICVVASTPPTLQSGSGHAGANGVAPILSGYADTGLSDPASCPGTAAALTAIATNPYCYVS